MVSVRDEDDARWIIETNETACPEYPLRRKVSVALKNRRGVARARLDLHIIMIPSFDIQLMTDYIVS